MKRLVISLMLLAAMAARAFDFSAVAPTGQTLYFEYGTSGTVAVVRPGMSGWGSYAMPEGRLEIPATVENGDGTTLRVTEIGDRVFMNCSGLTTVVVPEGVTAIGQLAFALCSSLDSIGLPSTLTRLGTKVFGSTPLEGQQNWTDNGLLIVDGYLVDSRSAIEGRVEIPEGTMGIGASSFYTRSRMTTAVLPASLRFVNEMAFADCASLDSIIALGANIPALSETALYGCGENVVCGVPCGSGVAYRAAPVWSDFDIVEMNCPDVALQEVSVDGVRVVSNAGGIVVSGVNGRGEVVVYDAMGRMVAHGSGERVEFRLSQSGVYVVVADGVAKRVIYQWR